MSAPPLISIITVVYNAVETLEYTIQSVVNQTYEHIEYVVIDGGSNDGTHEILEKYRSQISTLVIEKDEGIYDAMNKGLGLATGDWAYFLGADDLLLTPTIIAELVRSFKNPDHIYYGDTYLKNNNRIYNGRVNLMKLSLCNISHQAIFYPKSVYQQKRYDKKYIYFADHVHNLELYASDRTKFTYIRTVVSVYNDQGRSSTYKDHNYNNEIVGIMHRNFGPGLGAYVWLRRKVAKLKRALLKK